MPGPMLRARKPAQSQTPYEREHVKPKRAPPRARGEAARPRRRPQFQPQLFVHPFIQVLEKPCTRGLDLLANQAVRPYIPPKPVDPRLQEIENLKKEVSIRLQSIDEERNQLKSEIDEFETNKSMMLAERGWFQDNNDEDDERRLRSEWMRREQLIKHNAKHLFETEQLLKSKLAAQRQRELVQKAQEELQQRFQEEMEEMRLNDIFMAELWHGEQEMENEIITPASPVLSDEEMICTEPGFCMCHIDS